MITKTNTHHNMTHTRTMIIFVIHDNDIDFDLHCHRTSTAKLYLDRSVGDHSFNVKLQGRGLTCTAGAPAREDLSRRNIMF